MFDNCGGKIPTSLAISLAEDLIGFQLRLNQALFLGNYVSNINCVAVLPHIQPNFSCGVI